MGAYADMCRARAARASAARVVRAERARRYLERVEAGETYAQIGASEGITSASVIYFIRKEYGPPGAEPLRWRADLVREVDSLWLERGMSQPEIAKTLGVSFRAVKAICRTSERRHS